MSVGQTNRRAFIAGVGSAVAWPVVTHAQQQTNKVWRVGFLSPAFPPLNNPVDAAVFGAFRHEMSNLGYVEGKNLIIEGRWTEGQIDRLPSFANELVSLPSDAIVAYASGEDRGYDC